MLAPKLTAAIDAHSVATQERGHRRHLGASVIGDKCGRKIWYRWRWVLSEEFKGSTVRLFERGQLEESRFIALLRSVGATIWTMDSRTGKQFRVAAVNGHFGGSLDSVGKGIPDLPHDQPFLCEFKTHNEKSFVKLKEDGVLQAKWEHFVQMQMYMALSPGLEYALYCAVNKNTDELYFELVQLDQALARSFIERAELVAFATEPPPRIHKESTFYLCKFCHFNRLCHEGDVAAERNCRTCQHSFPSRDPQAPGTWGCRKRGIEISDALQKVGCESYKVMPSLDGNVPF